MKRGGVFYPEVCWSSTEDTVEKRYREIWTGSVLMTTERYFLPL